ncbi:MAG: hypothetical protein MN733_15525 [Nitrososphaera sp.]|nr:hypothetical protein [Nitrososphaera sp.]
MEKQSSKRKNLSGAQIGKLHAQRLREFRDTLKAKNKGVPTWRGEVNKQAISRACGFDRQVLHTNPECKKLLEEMVADLGMDASGDNESLGGIGCSKCDIWKRKYESLQEKYVVCDTERQELRKKLMQQEAAEEILISGRRWIP